jgi:hypothetical protein
MLPKNRLGRAMAHKLKVYAGADHPHGAQDPVPLSLGEIPKWEGLPKPEDKPAPKPKAEKAKRERTGPAQKAPARKTVTRKPAAKKSTAKRTTAKTQTARRSRSTKKET